MWSLNPHQPGCFWYPYAESFGPPNVKWCEQTLCQVISEPANTWSNLGYVLVAIWALVVAYRRGYSVELKQYGPILGFLGVMSFLYHLSNFYGSQILDFVGMFAFIGWVIGMNLIRLGKLDGNRLLRFILMLNVVLIGVMQGMRMLGLKYQSIILLATLLISFTEYLARHRQKVQYGYFFLSNLLLTIAFGFSISDVTRRFCDPQSHGWFSQGHALWHWIGALSMVTIFLHYSQPALRERDDRSRSR